MTISPDLDRRFRDAAATLGLIDVGFDLVDSPVGELLVAASDRGLAAISFDNDPEEPTRMARADRRARAFSVRRGASTVRVASSTSTSRGAGGRSTCSSTCARFSPSPSPSSASSRGSRTGDDDVRRARAPRRPSRGARRWDGDEPQPHPDRPPVPSRGRVDGRA
jgi:hypothetical protein